MRNILESLLRSKGLIVTEEKIHVLEILIRQTSSVKRKELIESLIKKNPQLSIYQAEGVLQSLNKNDLTYEMKYSGIAFCSLRSSVRISIEKKRIGKKYEEFEKKLEEKTHDFMEETEALRKKTGSYLSNILRNIADAFDSSTEKK